MFGKSKVSQSMIDAVLKVTESSKEEVTEAQQLDEANWEKEKTATGVKVYGSSYGNSAKAKKDQTKSAVDTLKGPKDKEVKEGYFSKQLMQSISEEEKIEKQINEVLSKDASAGAWIHDFVHSDNPKFSGKSKAKRKKMALAAYYAKQRNEEVEKEKSDEKSDHDKWKEAYKKAKDAGSSSSNAKARANGAVYEETELSEAKVTTTDENPDRVTTDDLTGREEGGKSNSFKAFKLKLKTDGEMKAPTEEKPEDTKARTSVKPGDAHVEIKPATIHAKEEVELSEGGFKRIATDREEDARLGTSPKKGTDVADKSWLKDAGKKPGALHNVGKGLKAFLKGKPEPMESVEHEGEQLDETMTRKHFQQVADVIKSHPDQEKRNELAKHHADIFKKSNPRFDHSRFYKAAGATLSEEQMDEAKRPVEDSTFVTNEEDKPTSWRKETPWRKSPGTVTDKSGAKHTPMSRAKDLARSAMKKLKTETLGKAPGNN